MTCPHCGSRGPWVHWWRTRWFHDDRVVCEWRVDWVPTRYPELLPEGLEWRVGDEYANGCMFEVCVNCKETVSS